MNYIWCVIDKGLKQISFIDSDGSQCQAGIEKHYKRNTICQLEWILQIDFL